MPSYVVTGASRGLGFEFLRQLSENPENTVIGLVRNPESSKEKIAKELNRPNIHILQGDLANYESIKTAAAETSKITGGKLDYLIANAGIQGPFSHLKIGDLAQEPEKLEKEITEPYQTNVIGNIHLINAFMPLILQGAAKKVIVLGTAMGDVEFVRTTDMWMGVGYSISKAALHLAIAKFSAQYREQGVLVLGISPGFVNTSDISGVPEPVMKSITEMVSKFSAYAPDWKGALAPSESVEMVLSVIEKASIEGGNAGDYLSHYGNKQWL
ncbi:hypothetical protein BX600DRAFT_556120 [Xylariales sp. PMI_506]|nr:hypothetical protein BX600DRAFT_556120 [Xylariales sp. PMI_506]